MSRGKIPLWAMKMAIWDSMATNGPRREVIYRDIERMKRDEKSPIFGEDTPDPRTIGDIIKEFQELTPDQLATLPLHVRECREDWEEMREKVVRISNEGYIIKVVGESEPSWVAEFARRLKDRIHVPGPASLLVKDLSEGRVLTYGENSGEAGYFYWDTRTGEPAIWLQDKNDPDSFLEEEGDDEDDFEEFLKRKPKVRSLIDEYKKWGIGYVFGAKELRDLIKMDAETMVKEALSLRGYVEKIVKDSVNPEHLDFHRGNELLAIKDRFFDDAYTDVIRKFQLIHKTDKEKEKVYKPAYRITKAGNRIWQLRLGKGGLSIARGPTKDLLELKKIHRAVVDNCLRQNSKQVTFVLGAHKKTQQIGKKLRYEL